MFAIFRQIDASVQKGSSEDLAILVRHYYLQDLGRTPSLHLDQLLRDSGFEIRSFPLGHLGALIVSDKLGNIYPVMMIDAKVKDFRRAFLLAYMFGYFLFEIQPKIITGNFKTSAYYQEECPLNSYLNRGSPGMNLSEERVLEFAAALFMPRTMIEKAREKGLGLGKVAQIFGVTEEFALSRTKKLNLPIADFQPPVQVSQASMTKTHQASLERIRELARKIDNR